MIWQHQLETSASQGDVITQVPFLIAKAPLDEVSRSTGKGGVDQWRPVTAPRNRGATYSVCEVHYLPAIVITHSCQLDKREKKRRVLVAPIRGASELEDEVWRNISAGLRKSMLPLPAVPELGDHYADLRLISAVDRAFVDVARVASMNERGRTLLWAHLVTFFTDRDLHLLDE